jgi:hypothetical protein
MIRFGKHLAYYKPSSSGGQLCWGYTGRRGRVGLRLFWRFYWISHVVYRDGQDWPIFSPWAKIKIICFELAGKKFGGYYDGV